MTPYELPLRWVPVRTPHPFTSFIITVASLSVAFGARFLVLGIGRGDVQTSTVFPAFILIAIYAGWRWSLCAVALVGILMGVAADARQGGLTPVDWLSLALYIASALMTVLVAGAVRELVIRIREEGEARASAEKDRRESETRFGTLADSAPTLMWVSNPDRTRVFVNLAYREFLGETGEDPLRIDWRARVHPDDLNELVARQLAGEASREPFTLQARYRRADGEYRWLQSISRPRIGQRNEFDGFIGIAFDITDAKRAEANLKHINELLAERVGAALEERDRAQAALMQAQKLEAVGQLTGGVAHDFNNLLTVVIGALDSIQRNPFDEKRRERMVNAALTAARRGEGLTQQLLAFSRRQALRPEALFVDDLLLETEPLLRRAVGEACELVIKLSASGAAAMVDPSQLEASLLNLVLNARDAVGAGGHITIVTSVITFDAPHGDCAPGDYFTICVHDDGGGMDPDIAAHAFEPFFTTKVVGKGTGLGLSQVYGFARQTGGDVKIETSPGEGTTVHLYLPLASAADVSPAPAAPQSTAAQAPLTVLLVEDDPAVSELVQSMLRELGHEVIAAVDADSALIEAARHPELGLMLTDVIMPGRKTGVDLAREMTRLRPSLPVILSSGYTGEALAGAEDAPWPLLRKPYTFAALGAVISETVRRKDAA